MHTLVSRTIRGTRRLALPSRAMRSAIMAMILWSTVASAFKLTLRTVSVGNTLLVASGVSAAVLFIALLREGKLHRLRRWSARDFGRSALLGALNPFAYYFLMFTSYDLLPAQFAQPVNYVWPVFLIVLSALLLGQRISFGDGVKVVLSFSGVLVISLGGGAVTLAALSTAGLVCALGSAAIWALYWLMNMKESRDPTVRLFVNFCFGFAYVLIWQLFRSDLLIPTGAGFLGAMYIGLFEMGITYLLWFRALTGEENSARVGNVIYLVPFLSLLLIALVVGEKIYPSTFAGLLLIMSGLLLGSVHRFSWAAAGRDRMRRLTHALLNR